VGPAAQALAEGTSLGLVDKFLGPYESILNPLFNFTFVEGNMNIFNDIVPILNGKGLE
jgi:hypothetical protein